MNYIITSQSHFLITGYSYIGQMSSHLYNKRVCDRYTLHDNHCMYSTLPFNSSVQPALIHTGISHVMVYGCCLVQQLAPSHMNDVILYNFIIPFFTARAIAALHTNVFVCVASRNASIRHAVFGLGRSEQYK